MEEYTEQLIVHCADDFREILIAELAALNFDSFQETDTGFIGHATIGMNREAVKNVFERYAKTAQASYHIEQIKNQNWNKKWEESYDPIQVGNQIFVRASFHTPKPDIPIEIIINPKMSFGTGHHETTYLMMQSQLEIDHGKKQVLDAGCGTGILTILAGKLGAANLVAFDNDEWVRDNIEENFKINHTNAQILIGTVSDLSFQQKFDIILANINKNVLLHDIPYYANLLPSMGHLLLSGFYTHDLADIADLCVNHDLRLDNTAVKAEWITARFLKK